MSEALEDIRAIDAIPARLADRMADAIACLQYFDRIGVRYAAYDRAGINRNDYPEDVWKSADAEAHSIELGRRFP